MCALPRLIHSTARGVSAKTRYSRAQGDVAGGSCFPDKEKFVPGPLRRFIRGDLIHQEKWFYDTAALSTPPYVLRFQQIPPLVGANADITGAVSQHD